MDIGAQLRSSRENRRLSLEALARTIRVQPRVLVAIERNDAAGLPPRPFGRGFVHAYAREVGLNPDQTVRAYFGQFAPPVDSAPEPPPVVKKTQELRSEVWSSTHAAVAVLAIAVLAVGATLLVRAGKNAPARDTALVGTSGGSAPTTASGDSAAPVPARAAQRPAPPASPPAHPLTILIQTSGPCWVSATADDRRVLYRLLQPGERATLEADKQITLLAGNAAALTWTVNGRAAGTFGAAGAVRTATITPANVSTIR